MKKTKYILPTLGENVLKNAENYYKENEHFSAEVFENMHSIYGASLEKALDLLDNSKIKQYHTVNNNRSLYIIGKERRQFKLFESINFCLCETFKNDVLQTAKVITCEHVLALKLAKITEDIIKEEINDLHFAELLKAFFEGV